MPNLKRGAPWWSGAFYLLYYGAGASLYPYLALRYRELGLSGDQIGLLAAIPQVVALFGASLWGAVADVTQRHRRLLTVAMAGVMASSLFLSSLGTFWLLVPAVAALSLFGAPIMPLIDNSTLEALGDRRREYGKLRLWGAIGWGITAPLIGRLIEWAGLVVSFFGYAILMGGCLLVSLRLSISRSSIGRGLGRGLRALFGRREWLLFLAGIWIGGVSLAAIHNYLFLYMADLGAGNVLMGVALSCATLGELSVFYYADRILARLGARKMIVLALCAHAVRVLAYSFIRTPVWVLPVQILHGLSFSALWVASVSYANEIAPEGMGTTAQGLLNSVFFGLGGSVGALLGGSIYARWGFPVMFRLSALAALLGSAGFLLSRPGKQAVRGVRPG